MILKGHVIFIKILSEQFLSADGNQYNLYLKQ